MKSRFPAWAGILAIVFQALWPLALGARPAATLLVPVCTTEGVTHYYELPAGQPPLDGKAGAQHEHCAFCSAGAALPVCPPDSALPGQVAPPTVRAPSLWHVQRFSLTQPRAPPLLPYAEIQIDDYRRIHEEELLAAGAPRADSGFRLLRGGVLHD